ncbi:MAG TPA: hypothetical protein VKL21_03610 [Candidatus Methanoperedens sp.]|nr:hypothetical protein [Candidatus Methanoperedens sp.]
MANKVKNSAIDFENNKFKEYLRISPCFFKMCLKTPAEFNKTFKKIFQLTMTKNPHNVELQNCFAIEAQKFKYYDKILEICVYYDIINNEASEEAIEYVLNMNRNIEVYSQAQL